MAGMGQHRMQPLSRRLLSKAQDRHWHVQAVELFLLLPVVLYCKEGWNVTSYRSVTQAAKCCYYCPLQCPLVHRANCRIVHWMHIRHNVRPLHQLQQVRTRRSIEGFYNLPNTFQSPSPDNTTYGLDELSPHFP